MHFNLSYNNTPVVENYPISIGFTDLPEIYDNLVIKKIKNTSVNETWEPNFLKSSKSVYTYNQVVVQMEETIESFRIVNWNLIMEIDENCPIGNPFALFNLEDNPNEFESKI